MGMGHAALRWNAMLLALCLLASISCSAQAAEEKQATAPALQIEVRRVLVPVVVRDRQGHAVDDLQQADFEILDEGKPGTISSFMMERLGGIAPASAPNGGSQAAPAAGGEQDAVVYPAHITVFLFDDLHLGFEDLVRVRAATVAALPGTLTGTDMAAVVSISGNVNTGLTRDRNKLEEALGKLAPHAIYRSDSAECPLIDYYEADLIENKHDPVAIEDANRKFANCNLAVDAARDLGGEANLPTAEHMVDAAARRVLAMGLQDVQTTYAAIGTLVNRLAPLPGERTLILVSPGFLNVEREAMEMESRIIDLAARQNIVVSALDSRGLYTTAFTASEKGPPVSGAGLTVNSDYRARGMKMAENPMEELADGTGGTFFHDNNDLNAGLKRMTEEPECVYLIELSLDGVKPNGSYHRLKVKVDREGVQLEARRGYFIPKPKPGPKTGKDQR
jgi:VWFA-related protein